MPVFYKHIVHTELKSNTDIIEIFRFYIYGLSIEGQVYLYRVQIGENPSSAKPMKGIEAGVFELVDNYATDTYRVVYTVKIGQNMYVLHCFQKKSKRGIKTRKKDIDLIKRRLRRAKEMEKNYEQ